MKETDHPAYESSKLSLWSSDEQLREFLNSAPLAAFSLDAEGIVVDWNLAAASFFSRSPAKIRGRRWTELVSSAEGRDRIEHTLAALHRSRAKRSVTKRIAVVLSLQKGREVTTEWIVTKVERDGTRIINVFIRELAVHTSGIPHSFLESRGILLGTPVENRAPARGHLIEDAIKICVAILGEVIGWPVTHAFIRSRDGTTFVSSGIWHISKGGDFQRLRETTELASISPGEDLPGRIWKTGEAAWITDLATDGNITRSADYSHLGIRSAFGIPVKIDNDVVAVIEFFHPEQTNPNVRLMNLARAVGDQLEYVIEGMRWHEDRSRLAAIVDSTGDAIIGKDLDGTITSWNVGAEDSYGWSAAEAIGQPISMIFPPGVDVDEKPMRDAAVRQAPLSNFETLRLHRDGRVLNVAVTVAPILDQFGSVVGSSTIERDITMFKLAQHQLEEREAQFRQLLDSSASAIFGVDSEGKCTFCNAMCASLLGLSSPEELIGTDMYRLVRDSDARGDKPSETESLYLRSLRDGLVTHVEHETFQLASGRMLPVEFWTFPMNRLGKQTGSVVTFIDISERLDAESERARLAAIVDSSGDAIISRSRDGMITSWNTGAELVYGWLACEAVGQTISLMLPPGLAREESEILQAIKTGRRLDQYETRRQRRDGNIIDVSITLSPIWNPRGGIVGFSTIERDITSRLRRVRELREARDAAEEANRVQAEFLANVSHELRTPMNAILGMLELALQENISSGLKDYLRTAKDSADSLLLIVNDILDISRLEAGRFELDCVQFDVRAMLDDAVKLLSLRAYEKGLELACRVDRQVPSSVLGDPIRLRQIVTNLMGNAIKFTDQGEVVIDVRLKEVPQESLDTDHPAEFLIEFCISDTGIGIAPEDQERIFAPFTQADSSSTRRFSGTGLGLAICHELVTMMGGEIWLESEPERGSRFYFTVALSQAEEDFLAETLESAVVAELKALPVLVIDDNETTRKILEEYLSNWSMRPTTVSSAKQGLEKLKACANLKQPFSLVIVDAMMPEIDGFTLIDEARDAGALDCATILMHSSADRQVFHDRFQNVDVAVSLEKPVSQSDLLDAIMTALKGPQLESGSVARITEAYKTLRVLVTEDTPANQKVIKAILEKRGHHITIANNGREALECLKGQPFDVVLMDLQMPIMDGLQATVAIRKSETANSRLPIIAMTAHAMRGDREKCLSAGMDGYIAKPIDSQELIRLVERHAEEFGAARHEDRELETLPSRFDPPAQPVMKLDAALNRFDHDAELLSDLVGYFLEDSPSLLDLAHRSMHDNNAAELTRAAHSLKGLCANFEAFPAIEAAATLENIGRNGDFMSAAAAITVLETEIARLTSALQAWQARIKSNETNQ